ncbi:MAG: diguanylate cyclase [Sedimenticola sp.]
MRISLERYQDKKDDKDLAMVNRIIADAAKASKGVDDILVMGLDGKVLASVTHRHDGESLAYLPLYTYGKEMPTASIVSVDESSAPQFFHSAPLVLEDSVIGLIAMQVSIDDLYALLEDYTGLGETGEVLMGIKTENGDTLLFSPLRFEKSPMLVAKNSNYAVAMQNALSKRDMLLDGVQDYRQKKVIAVTRYLSELDLGIVVKIDSDEIFKAQHDLQMFMLQSVIAMVLVVFIASFLLARIITKPVIDITHVATLISEGDLERRVHEMSQDELGQLAKALNSMADSLIDTNTLLEQKVKERTADLMGANERLKKMARLDGLTGVANRRSFDDKLDEEWRRCMRSQTPISLIMVDLDYFKKVNDIAGHQIGDECLKSIASALSQSINRPGDMVARYGGEEFALILQDTPETFAEVMAETMRKMVLECKVPHPDSDISPYVTISVGVATTVPQKNEQASSLVTNADNALYQAKQTGRNKVVVWHNAEKR